MSPYWTMADSPLLQRIRRYLESTGRLGEFEEKPIVGGTGLMMRGNLLCGDLGGELLVRLGKEGMARVRAAAKEAPDGEEPIVRPMIMGGRESRNWYLVRASVVRAPTQLAAWIDLAVEFGQTLPTQ